MATTDDTRAEEAQPTESGAGAREPVSPATKALLDAADEELGDAHAMLEVLCRSLDDSLAEERTVLGRANRMLLAVCSAIEHASMGCPRTSELWPGLAEDGDGNAADEVRQ